MNLIFNIFFINEKWKTGVVLFKIKRWKTIVLNYNLYGVNF